MSAQRTPRSSFRSGFLIGGLVGAAVGILLAPRPGSQTREQLVEQASEALAGQGLDEQVNRIRETFAEVREILREAIAEGREVLREAIEEGRKAGARTEEEMRRRYREATGHEE